MTGAAGTRIQTLIISGSMGAGKTTMLGELADLLEARAIPHAAIDLDWLGHAQLPGETSHDIVYRNLAAVWANYVAAGITRAVLAEPIDSAAARDRLLAAMPGADLIICRLRASLETMRGRVERREPGLLQGRYVTRVAELEAQLDVAGIEDFSVLNDGRSITDVAREILSRAGWA